MRSCTHRRPSNGRPPQLNACAAVTGQQTCGIIAAAAGCPPSGFVISHLTKPYRHQPTIHPRIHPSNQLTNRKHYYNLVMLPVLSVPLCSSYGAAHCPHAQLATPNVAGYSPERCAEMGWTWSSFMRHKRGEKLMPCATSKLAIYRCQRNFRNRRIGLKIELHITHNRDICFSSATVPSVVSLRQAGQVRIRAGQTITSAPMREQQQQPLQDGPLSRMGAMSTLLLSLPPCA